MSPLEMLEALLTGTVVTPDELDLFIDEHSKEGLHHDFKHGNELKKPKPHPANTLKEYLSAFANSDGGFVVFGVSEPPRRKGGKRRITGAKAPGGGALDDWADTTILEIASHFSIQPRFQVVNHPKGDVLIGSAARSAQLVPVIVSRRWKFFIRTQNSTIEAPAYLISDLVLGRRNHPIIGLGLQGASRSDALYLSDGRVPSWSGLDFTFSLENLSLVPADDITVGIVSWQPSLSATGSTVSERLRYYVEEMKPEQPRDPPFQLNWVLRHVSSTEHFALNTFGRGSLSIGRGLIALDDPRLNPVARAGVYVLPKGAPPTWYQLTCATSGFSSGVEKAEADACRLCRLEPVVRPRIHWARMERLTPSAGAPHP